MLDMYHIARGNVLLVFLMLVFPALFVGGHPAPAPVAAPVISAHPESFSTCVNDPGQALIVEATGPAPLNYSWQQKKGTGNWTVIEGAGSSSYTPSTRQAGTTFYRARVTAGDGSAIYSNAATVTIYRPPSFGISAPREAVCLNSSLTIRSSIDLSIWDIEWEKSTDSLNWTLTGIHDPQIAHPTSETGTAWYRLIASPKGIPNPICDPVSAPVRIQVMDCMRLSVSKTASPQKVSAGDTLIYTIQLTNRGPSALIASQVIQLKEQLPASGFNLRSVTADGSLDLDGQTWTGLSLQPGERATATLAGIISADYTGGPLLNRVTVIPPDGVKNTSRADSLDETVTSVLRSADLEILKRPLQSPVKAGQALQFRITVINHGPSRILPTDVFNVKETLPAGYQVRNYEAGEGIFNYLTGDWTETDMAAGDSVTLTVYGFVSSDLSENGITNTVRLTPPDEVADPVLPNISSITVPVSREADLELVKSGPSRMAPNETVWYTVRVTNNGPSYARDVLITDPVPSELTDVGWSAQPGAGATILSGETGTGNQVAVRADLPPGSTVTVRINGTVQPGTSGEIVNSANATLPPDIPDPTPNQDTLVTRLAGIDNLLLRKHGLSRAVAGQRITWTIQLINNSPDRLENIRLSDVITPANILRNVSWKAVPNDSGVVITQTMGSRLPFQLDVTLPSQTKATITISGRIPAEFTGEIINEATAETGQETLGDSVTTAVRFPTGIEVIKTGPVTAEAGGELTYTIQVTNTDRGTASRLAISDQLPLGSTYVQSDEGETHHINSHTVSWPVFNLNPGASVIRRVRIRAPADALEIINSASVAGQRDTAVTTIVPVVDLSVAIDAPDSVYQDDVFPYTIIASNNGPSTGRNITLTAIIPPGLEIADAGSGTVNGQKITWTIGSLPFNGVQRRTVDVRAPGESLLLTGTSTIRSESGDPDTTNNRSSARTHVLPAADLLIEKTGPDSAYAGEQVEYQLTVTNLGPSPAESIRLTDRLPSGMRFVSADLPPEDSLANPLEWHLPPLDTGTSHTVAIRVTVPGRVGPTRNTADVSAAVHDKDGANNRAVFTTEITPAADVEVIKEGTTAIDSAGIIRYEILVRNNGPSTALQVSITDDLPSNLDAPVSISNGGIYDPAGHRITWPDLPAMAAGTERLLTVRVPVLANATAFTAINTANISSQVFDPLTGNNRSAIETTIYPPADVYFKLEPRRVCKGQIVVLSGGGVRNDVPGTAVYSGSGVSDSLFHSEGLEPGTYVITYTFTAPGGTIHELQDSIDVLPTAMADAGPDLEILEGDSIVLDARATGEVITWSPTDGMEEPNVVRAVVAPTVNTTYRLTAENPGICSATDEVTVFVYPRLTVPNAFTPNDDAVNDTWRIVNIEEYPDATVQVFNRNGDRLFFSRGYAEEWEGEFNNEPVPAGTYYYVIRPNGGILKPLTGSVTIIR